MNFSVILLSAYKISLAQSGWYILLCIFIALLCSFILYFRFRAEMPLWMKRVLFSLRFVGIFLICFLLLEPFLSALLETKEKPIVVILQDNSESVMMQKDSLFMKNEYKKSLADLIGDKDLSRELGMEFRLYKFSNDVSLLKDTSSLRFEGSHTNISNAVEKISEIYRNQNLSAIILSSDGIFNEGTNPVYSAENLAIPVYTVLLGDTSSRKDVKIKYAAYNELSYLGNEIPVRVEIESSGYAGRNVNVTLSQNGENISVKPLQMDGNNFNGVVDFSIVPEEEGIQIYQIKADELPEEFTYKNNYLKIFINVLKSKQKILLVSGSPTPDIGAMKRAIESNKNYSVDILSRKDANSFYVNPDEIKFPKYSVFILHNFPFVEGDKKIIQSITNQIQKNKTGVFYFIGNGTNFSLLKSFDDYLGVQVKRNRNSSSEAFLYFSSDYPSHSTYTFHPSKMDALLKSAPPLQVNDSEFEPRANAKVFGKKKIKGIQLEAPVFVLQESAGAERNAVFIGDGLWKLRAYDFSENKNFELFDTWMQNIIQWLASREDTRKFRVKTTKSLYEATEDVIFKGEMYDENYNKIPDGDCKVKLRDAKNNVVEYYLQKSSAGNYELNIGKLSTGTYYYEADGKFKEQIIGTDKGSFSVSTLNLEFLNTRADFDLMNQLALRTHAKMFLQRDIKKLRDELLNNPLIKPREVYTANDFPLQRWIYPLLIIVFLFTMEWILRKRYGMI